MLTSANAASGSGSAKEVGGNNTEGDADNLQVLVEVISLTYLSKSMLTADAETVPAGGALHGDSLEA
jgi:hypothetical protein